MLINLVLLSIQLSATTILNLSGGGAAAMSLQPAVIQQLEKAGRLNLEEITHAYCVSGGCGSGILLQRLGSEGALNFMRELQSREQAVTQNLFTTTFMLNMYDGLVRFDPLKMRLAKVIKGKKPKFPLTIQVTDFDTMTPKYIDTAGMSDQELLDWLGAAKAVPGLVETYKGRYVDAAISNPFATEPIYAREDFSTLKMILINAHLRSMPARETRTAVENFQRTITYMVARKNLKTISEIKRKMLKVGNKNLLVYSMTENISTFQYTPENIRRGIEHGRELRPTPFEQISED